MYAQTVGMCKEAEEQCRGGQREGAQECRERIKQWCQERLKICFNYIYTTVSITFTTKGKFQIFRIIHYWKLTDWMSNTVLNIGDDNRVSRWLEGTNASWICSDDTLRSAGKYSRDRQWKTLPFAWSWLINPTCQRWKKMQTSNFWDGLICYIKLWYL